MDWGAVFALAVVTWLDGVRRVPADALVLRRVLGASWAIADPVDSGRTWRLVAWWSPLTLALVVPAGGIVCGEDEPERTPDAVDARVAACARTVVVLRVLGASVLLAIVGGVPAATARFGTWGFVAVIAGALFLSFLTSLVAMRAVRRLRFGWRRAGRVAAPLLWPFAAPRAAELVLEHAVAGAPPLAVARLFLGDAEFTSWVRPRAYDALTAGTAADGLSAALLSLVGRSALAAIVGNAPAGCESNERYCARCGRVYRSGTALCADCRTVSLSSPVGS